MAHESIAHKAWHMAHESIARVLRRPYSVVVADLDGLRQPVHH